MADIAREMQIGDLVIFHVLRPAKGIIAVCKVASEVYENHYSNIWGKNKYPLRLKVEFVPDMMIDENEPIPLGRLFYDAESKKELVVEPFMKGVCITQITSEQFERLKSYFKQKNK
jgi:predicted RNA-binding protein with PUA-like domain